MALLNGSTHLRDTDSISHLWTEKEQLIVYIESCGDRKLCKILIRFFFRMGLFSFLLFLETMVWSRCWASRNLVFLKRNNLTLLFSLPPLHGLKRTSVLSFLTVTNPSTDPSETPFFAFASFPVTGLVWEWLTIFSLASGVFKGGGISFAFDSTTASIEWGFLFLLQLTFAYHNLSNNDSYLCFCPRQRL